MLRVTVPSEIYGRMRTALSRAGSRECGGVLMGEHVGHNHFVVRDISVQTTGGFARFTRGVSNAATAIREFLKAKGNDYRRYNYMGEWHSHPSFSISPSSKDHATMRDMATSTPGANFLVLLVVRLDGVRLMGSAHTYLPNGTLYQSDLELEA